jgi:hypothetical protein
MMMPLKNACSARCCLQDLSWSKLHINSKAQPTSRSGHVATLVNDSMLVFGGAYCNCGLRISVVFPMFTSKLVVLPHNCVVSAACM